MIHHTTEMPASILAQQAEPLSVEQVRTAINDAVAPIVETETVPLQQALMRVLASDLISPINVPAHDNSAMDGYALRAADVGFESRPDGVSVLRIVGDAFGGKPFTGEVRRGECIAITTGAVMPAGCDTVVPQEAVLTADEHAIRFASGRLRPGDNRRTAGEDLAAGSIALKQGTILQPADIGLLASLGQVETTVMRRLRVAFFSTGNELRAIGEPLTPGCVYDSNRYTIQAMLTRLGCEPIDLGMVCDDPAALEEIMRRACEQADVVITSGGVSIGAADFTRDVMARLGEVAFWTIAMRPGRPMAFGRIVSNDSSAVMFGLPGNPVAVMATFCFVVRQGLQRMMGANPAPIPLLQALSDCTIRKTFGRVDYLRGIVYRNAEGSSRVRITGAQGSGILRSMSEANCFIVLSQRQQDIAVGDLVDIALFNGLM